MTAPNASGLASPRVRTISLRMSRLHDRRELVERLAPSLVRALAVRSRRETRVGQGEPRLPLEVLERHGHEHLERDVRAHAVVRRGDDVPVLVREAVRLNELLPGNDLTVHARAPVVLPVRRTHAVNVPPADA